MENQSTKRIESTKQIFWKHEGFVIHDTKRIRIRQSQNETNLFGVRICDYDTKRIHIFTNLLYESRILTILYCTVDSFLSYLFDEFHLKFDKSKNHQMPLNKFSFLFTFHSIFLTRNWSCWDRFHYNNILSQLTNQIIDFTFKPKFLMKPITPTQILEIDGCVRNNLVHLEL